MPERISREELRWREKRPGRVMSRKTFKKIEREAARRGAKNPRAVAGATYWRTLKSKYRRSRRGSSR